MTGSDLAELVGRAKSGVPEAYDELIRRYSGPLYGYLVRCLGNRTEADDLLQEVFLRLVRGLSGYREREKFEVWLFRLAHNLVIDYWRKRRVLSTADLPLHREDEEEGSLTDTLVGKEADPAWEVELGEDKDRLQWALQQLPPQQRETVLLRYFSGVSFQEIAAVTGCPLGTALARAHRALGKLKQLLEARSE